MAGELAHYLRSSWKEIWQPLGRSKDSPTDLFNELVRELVAVPTPPAAPAAPPPQAFDNAGVLVDPIHLAI